MLRKPIYLDYAATTPVDQRVIDVMVPYFHETFGNSSSIHWFGQRAEAVLEDAREIMAGGLNCNPEEVIFTSCGSESDNLAIRGAALAAKDLRNANHILISPVEHHAVSKTVEQLSRLHGFELEYLPVDQYGMVNPEEVRRRLRENTAVVSVIYANNEIGTINPIADIGLICRDAGIPFHTDAVQAAGFLSVDVQDLNVDFLSLGAHKFYGPKGVGALYKRSDTMMYPSQTGGGQEFGLRAGTHNIAFIAGMAKAFELAIFERQERITKILPLRNFLIGQVLETIPESMLSGHPEKRLPNHASFVFKNVDGNALLMMLDLAGYACSSGSACKTGDPEPSDVLMSIGFEKEWSLGSLRITLGCDSTPDQIHEFCATLPDIVENNRLLKDSGQ